VIRPRLTVPLVVLLAIVASACSSGSTPTSAGGPTSAPGGQQTQNTGGGGGTMPCAAIQTVVSTAVGAPVTKTEFTGTKCEYDFGGSGDTAGMGGVVDVRRELTGSTDLTAVKAGFPGGDDVSGLGDAAYWAKSVYVMYAVSHGSVYAVQTVLIDSSKDLKTMETNIMQALLTNL
jgi:hypothetical protein